MYDFRETLTIEVPAVDQQLSAFLEKEHRNDHGLIIEVAAIHEGLTANHNFYSAKALEEALASWVSPYPKPIIMNHDPYSEPVGRVMAARMDHESDGTPYTKLQVAITDPEAITKVLDQRYLTGSVGGQAKQANCSICKVDWAEASIGNIPCKHRRGKTYKGKLAYMEMNGVIFKEYSFVNMPADQKSSVRSIGTVTAEAQEDDGWVRAARIFSLDMNEEKIVEFSEASEDRDVLDGLKKKEATPIYMQLKGAFLSALAVAESGQDNKEPDVKEEILEEEEDILAVAEGLSSDLSATEEPEEVTEEEETEEISEEEEEAAEVEEEVTAEEEETEIEETEEEEATVDATEEEEVAEGKSPEGQESPKSQDIDPDNSEGAPVSREEEEVAEETEEEEETVTEEEPVAETDLSEVLQTLESRVEALEAREQDLLEENAKLKAALKRTLAERVVDTKIAMGVADSDDREELLAEHVERSASSLADSIRDLAAMPQVRPNYDNLPTVDEMSGAVEEDGPIVDSDEESVHEDKELNPEDILVDALMGRRSL